jgi:DivIVA domain-containing protein
VTWLFAVVVVAVIAAVAVVATGRGGAMSEAYDDRRDVRVQADGPLTAEDLERVRFTTAFRGYRTSEVDALLDRLMTEMRAPGPGASPGAEPPEAGGSAGGAVGGPAA